MKDRNHLIEFEKDEGHKQIWGKAGFHRKTDQLLRSGGKSFSLRNAAAFSCVLLSCGLLFLKGRINKHSKETSNISFNIVQSNASAKLLEIPPLKRNEVDAAKAKRPEVLVPRNFERLGLVKFNSLKSIPPGSQVKAKLLSGASTGRVKAITLEPLIVDGDTLLESGVTLIGSGRSTEERLFIGFNKIIFRDGTVKTTEAQAFEASDLISGLKGSRVGYHATRLAAGIGLNFASGLAAGLQEKENIGGVVANKADMKNALLNGAQSAALEYSKSLMEAFKDEAPLIEVPYGTVFYILFDGGDH